MNFGFSSCSQPMCEEHFHFGAREDKTLEVEDLSIRGQGNAGSAADKLGKRSQKGGENSSRGRGGKKKGAKSRREREGDNDQMVNCLIGFDYDYEDEDEEDEDAS